MLAGTSGLALTFSWLDPLRPYLIGTTVLVLGFAWYQKLKPQKEIDCNCDTQVMTPFIQSKKFLSIVTAFTALMLAFPVYSHLFYPNAEVRSTVSDPSNIQTATFEISGMTCTGCENHIIHEVNKLNGILNTTVSYEAGNATIAYDKTKTDIIEIEQAILQTGYSVTEKKELR